jgi:hypothetical protein
MGKRKDIIRVGDTVRIINPIVVDGCGYRRDFNFWNRVARRFFGKKVRQYIKDNRPVSKSMTYSNRLETKIVRVIASELLGTHMRGGVRRLKTRENPQLKDKEYTVCEVKIYRTGKYVPSSSSYDWEGGYDYEPAYLENSKTHKVLNLGFWSIEACNVEKIG